MPVMQKRVAQLNEIKGWVFLLSVLLYLLSVVLPFHILQASLAYCSIATLFVAFPSSSKTSKLLTCLFLVTGFSLALRSPNPTAGAIIHSFGSMLNLLCLFSVVPILAIPVKVGDYQQTIERLLIQRKLTPRYLYISISFFSYVMASLMNIAAIPMMYHSLTRLIEKYGIADSKRFLVKSIVIGYTMPLAWSPIAGVVAAVISVTNVQWLTVFPITLGLSIVGLALDAALFHPPYTPEYTAEIVATLETPVTPNQQKTSQPVRGLWQIGLAIVIFVAAMLSLQTVSGWSMIEVIGVVSIPFAWIWSLLLGEPRRFVQSLKSHQMAVRNLQNTFAVFTAAGFFVQSLHASPYIKVVDSTFVHVSHVMGPALFVAFIPLVTVLLSLIGLHPVISIALLGTSLHPSVLHLSPIWLAVALLEGGVITFIVSPFNATLNVAGAVSGELVSTVMRWNLKFCVCFLLFIMSLVALGELLFG